MRGRRNDGVRGQGGARLRLDARLEWIVTFAV